MENRSPTSVLLLGIVTLGLYGLVWLNKTRNEMVAQGADIKATWMVLVPIVGLIWALKYSQGVAKVTNGAMGTGMAFILLMFAGPIGGAIMQGEFNKVAAAPEAPAPEPAAAEEPSSTDDDEDKSET